MDLLRSRSASSRIVGRRSGCSEISWSQYQPITMRTTMYTHSTGREESTRVRVTGRAHAG
eukprot:829723-Prymnesium_polylepis.1